MSILDTVREYVSSGPTVTEYRCNGCGATFDSAKPRERASCPECLEHDVAPRED